MRHYRIVRVGGAIAVGPRRTLRDHLREWCAEITAEEWILLAISAAMLVAVLR